MTVKKLKISWAVINIALFFVTLTLIPLNFLAVKMPEWLPAFLSVISTTGLVSFMFIFKEKLVLKIIGTLVFSIITLIWSFFPYIFPYWNSNSFSYYSGTQLNYDEQIAYKTAKSDLDYVMRYLKKVHPAFKNGLSDEIKEGYNGSLEKLKSADKITVNDLRREIQIIINPLRDAHTTTYNNYPNDLFLKDAPAKTSAGYGINSVNGMSVAEIIQSAKPYFSYESEAWINIDLGSLAELDFYGFSSPFVFVWSDGENVITETYAKDDFVSYRVYLEEYNKYFTQTQKDFVRYETDEEKSLATLTLTQCIYNDTYKDCVNEMFTEIRQKNIKNVAIDVRGNGGGHSGVANEFIKYLPVDTFIDCPSEQRWGFVTIKDEGLRNNKKYEELTFEGNVYILTNSSSFSSAMDFAQMIQDNKLGKVIGEPPANKVTGYGDISYFILPKTGLAIQISTKKWYRCDSTNQDEYVMPDYPCNGRDVFQTLYSII